MLQTYPADAGRLPVCLASHTAPSDALRPASLSQAAWHRRLPDIEDDKPAKKQFKHYPTVRQRNRFAFAHIFDRVCHGHGIEHRLTQGDHPWTNGQMERVNRTLKEAMVKNYHYQTHQHLKAPLQAFQMAYNSAKRLKTLRGLTSNEYICQCRQKEPERFRINPLHHTVGLSIRRSFEWPKVLDKMALIWIERPQG